tara:strand:+ start:251 stop:616 length:366 start_codon:yes stop_codon:yes gene_type:complete
MPFALVPEGFKLQKVTKQQLKAVETFNSNKNIEAFFEGPASSEAVKAAAIVVTPIVLAVLTKLISNSAKEGGFDIAEDAFALLLRLNPVTLPADAALSIARQTGFITEEQEAEIRNKLPIL